MESFWKSENPKPKFCGSKTSNERGYHAEWLIEDRSLFLIGFSGELVNFINNQLCFEQIHLNDIFPPIDQKVFADWFTGDLIIPIGSPNDFSISAVGDIYPAVTKIIISCGIVINSGTFIIE
jgi:hypothetical protein